MRRRWVLCLAAIALSVGGCATVHNLPLNTPSENPFAGTMAQAAAAATQNQPRGDADGTVIGLAFSGGGTRAAAFSYGVLTQLARTPSPDRSRPHDLLDHVGIVSGVSGGSFTAAYYGLKGRAALADFREKFLIQDLMSEFQTAPSLVNISRALEGGVNTDNRMRNWLNTHLFNDASYSALIARWPIVLINATDVYSRTPFLFAPATFGVSRAGPPTDCAASAASVTD